MKPTKILTQTKLTFLDLFMICREESLSISNLIKKAKIKFDWHVDPLKLGSQFLLCQDVKDYPNLIVKVKETDWQNFFLDEARSLNPQIFSK